ncbi:MAG TPA: alpha/beta hydrolase-fold protein [Gaiellaceae bacterium]|nr:alpha/beta hydrolase-fold protein [Gaiellaceae bacterium]
MSEVAKPTLPEGIERRLLLPAAAAAVLLFLLVGALGLYRYLDSYWLYRGFPPPKDPSFVKQQGTIQTIHVASPAIGGRSEPVDVYLPPGYATSTQRYPVLYLLHGFPGDPAGFVRTVRVGVVEDTLLAKNQMKPTIIVMPMGSTGIFTDKEWANGIHQHEAWETFFARDVVNAVDRQFRTIPRGAARAVGGLSEGGYASFNIGLHHPAEFRVLESWSGYEKADNVKSIFDGRQNALAYNSPLQTLPKAAKALRREGAYLWFYTGDKDSLRKQNFAFAAELSKLHVPHHFFVVSGGHNWALWRTNAWQAVSVASAHLAHG